MKKVIRLTEKDLQIIVKRVLNEGHTKSKYGILNESYLPAVQEGDSECDIVCERKQAKFGSNGSLVKRIQRGLSKCGFNVEREGGGMMPGCKDDPNKCDGLFRKETKKAVEEFQKKNQLRPDGAVGKATLLKLQSNGCLTFEDCDCSKLQKIKTLPIDNQDQLRDVDCYTLKKCLQQFMSTGTSGVPPKTIDIIALERCLKGKQKPDGDKPKVNGCIYESGAIRRNCPATINCMPSPNKPNPCDSPMNKWCIAQGCTKTVN
jgi:hypothetical protein